MYGDCCREWMYCVRYDGCITCMGTVAGSGCTVLGVTVVYRYMGTVAGSGCTVLDMTVVSHIWGLLPGVDVLC